MSEDDPLRARALERGFTPGARDIPGLLDLLADDDDAPAILRALERAGARAATAAIARHDTAAGAHRARLCELVGRFARAGEAALTGTGTGTGTLTLIPWLLGRLHDPEPRVRRRAVTAIGKLEDPRHEAALVAAWHRADTDPERKVIAAALGQSGASAALAVLAEYDTADPELERVVRESVLKLGRTQLRDVGSSIDLDAVPPSPRAIALWVRPGLESRVCAALPGARPDGRGRVAVEWSASLRALYSVRTFIEITFPLTPVRLRDHSPAAVEDAVVRALAADDAAELMIQLTRGPVRWRLEWLGQGHRRGSTWRVVEALALLRPELVNDPRGAPWEVRVAVERDLVRVELRPRGLDDPRFTWRRGSVPASSHPTVAAALAEAAGVRDGDVVWDPFVGAGAELVERALLGPYASLLGTDLDPAALDHARANLAAAEHGAASLVLGDACLYRPATAPSLVVTNPPMGHRVRTEGTIAELLGRALDHWLGVGSDDMRVVWLSPVPERTAAHRGVEVRLRQPVDLGGLPAELQILARRVDAAPGYGRRRR